MSDSVYGASIGGGGSPLQTPLLGQTVNPAGALLDWNKARASQFAPAQAEAQVGLTKAQAGEATARAGLTGVQAQQAGFGLGILQQQYGRLYGGNDPTSISGTAGTPWEQGNSSGGAEGGNSGYAGTPGSPNGASLVRTQQPAIGATPAAPAAVPQTPQPAIGSGNAVVGAGGAPPGPTASASPTPGIGVFATESEPVSAADMQAQAPGPPPGPPPQQQPARQGTPNRGALSGLSAPNGQAASNVTGAGGTVDPLLGFATPKGWALGFFQAQDKGAERTRLFEARQQLIGAAIQSTIDPRTGQANLQLWNQATRSLFDQGFITLQEARDHYNRPDLAGNVINGLLKPSETSVSRGASAAAEAQGRVGPETQLESNKAAIKGDFETQEFNVPHYDANGNQDGVTPTRMTINEAKARGLGGAPATGPANPNAPMSGAAFGSGITGQENNTGNPAARNQSGPGGTATSSAVGNAQFLKDTWLDVAKRNAPQLTQGKTDEQILAMRSDPALSAQMATAYAKENSAVLDKAGLPVNATTLGMAHGFGPEGARKLLNAPADASASSVLGQQVMDANPTLRGKTVADVVGGYKNRWGLGAVQFDQPGGTKVAGPGAGPSGNDVLSGATTAQPQGGVGSGNVVLSPEAQKNLEVQTEQRKAEILAATQQQTEVAKAYGEQAGANIKAASAAPESLRRLDEMQAAATEFRTGATADIRQKALQGITEAIKLTGATPPDWMTKSLSGSEVIGKEGTQLAAIMTRMLGSREAASVFDQLRNANPNMKMSEGGFEAVLNSIRAGVVRDRDLGNFQEQWLAPGADGRPGHSGSIAGMLAEFNKTNSPESYASRVIPFNLPSSKSNMQLNVRYRLGNNEVRWWDGNSLQPVPAR